MLKVIPKSVADLLKKPDEEIKAKDLRVLSNDEYLLFNTIRLNTENFQLSKKVLGVLCALPFSIYKKSPRHSTTLSIEFILLKARLNLISKNIEAIPKATLVYEDFEAKPKFFEKKTQIDKEDLEDIFEINLIYQFMKEKDPDKKSALLLTISNRRSFKKVNGFIGKNKTILEQFADEKHRKRQSENAKKKSLKPSCKKYIEGFFSEYNISSKSDFDYHIEKKSVKAEMFFNGKDNIPFYKKSMSKKDPEDSLHFPDIGQTYKASSLKSTISKILKSRKS